MKATFSKIGKYISISVFMFLLFFNVNLLTDGNGWSIQLVKSVFALPQGEDPDSTGVGGGNGSSTKGTYFANYGSRSRMVYCQKVYVGFTGIGIEYYFAYDIWDQYWCVNGGNVKECTLGTGQHRNFQAGCNG